jgi:hypothetical protein
MSTKDNYINLGRSNKVVINDVKVTVGTMNRVIGKCFYLNFGFWLNTYSSSIDEIKRDINTSVRNSLNNYVKYNKDLISTSPFFVVDLPEYNNLERLIKTGKKMFFEIEITFFYKEKMEIKELSPSLFVIYKNIVADLAKNESFNIFATKNGPQLI